MPLAMTLPSWTSTHPTGVSLVFKDRRACDSNGQYEGILTRDLLWQERHPDMRIVRWTERVKPKEECTTRTEGR